MKTTLTTFISIFTCTLVMAQRVGININNPSSDLQIHGENRTFTSLKITQNSIGTGSQDGLSLGIQYDPNSPDNRYGTLYMFENYPLYFATNSAFRMTISQDGKVGIGTTTPNADLHIHHPTSVFPNILFTNGASGSASTDGMVVGMQYEGASAINRYGAVITQENIGLILGTNNAFRAIINADGNTTFGNTNNYNAKLAVVHNSTTSSPTLKLIETGSDYARLELNTINSTRYWHIAGYNSPSATNVDDRLNFFLSVGGNLLVLKGDGNAVLSGTLSQNSDERLKTNIEPMNESLDKIAQLNGYKYNWKSEQRSRTAQLGVLAQEVQKVFPELVDADEKGELSVNYMGLVPALIESIKTLNQKIDQQQKEIEALKKL